MRTVVRFGGLTEASAVTAVPDGGIAGFVFGIEASPRSVPAERFPDLLSALPSNVEAWAQVQDPSVETIRRLFDEIGVDRIEVHGAVPAGLEFLEIHHLVPALALPAPGAEGPVPVVPPADDYPRLLLDGPGTPLKDGHAVGGNWEVGRRLVDEQPGRKLALSGGLTATNVAEAVLQVRPWGVGVCAAVESAPGRSDPERMRAFVEALAAADP